MIPVTRFAEVVDAFRGAKGITLPAVENLGKRRRFGSSGLKVNGKIFAMLSSDQEFIVKLPPSRVDKLVASRDGKRFDPRKNGHVMKEWLVVGPKSMIDWLVLAREARDFVAQK